MSDLDIRVENLSKEYEIVRVKTRHDTLRDQIVHGVTSLFRRNGYAPGGKSTFRALNDVSFELRRGEVLGIIGRNGAGKSTLLKILSRITEPTSGYAEIRGRVGSLLEVGTGFHPELSGRENVYLNGAILGMKRAEITRKFDEIVSFAEVESFIDTPVKRYSSGMYVRLAFAVAAHLEPDILIVDEVLAVGDVAFQKKCLGKMGDVAKQGRTVLFVSHNMAPIQNLCGLGIVLQNGNVSFFGPATQAVEHYLSGTSRRDVGAVDLTDHPGRPPGTPCIIRSLALVANGSPSRYRDSVKPGDDLVFELGYDTGDLRLDYAVLAICSSLGERVCTVGTHLCPEFDETFCGKGKVRCRVPNVALVEGQYSVLVAMGRRMQTRNIDYVEDALRFRVDAVDYFGTGAGLYPGQGHFAVRSHWNIVPAGEGEDCWSVSGEARWTR